MDSVCNRKSKVVSRHTGLVAGNVKYYQRCVCICFATNHQCGGCRSMRNFWIAIALLVGILLLQTLLSAVNRFVNEYTETVIENGFKQRLFSALLNGRYASVTAVHSGEWMNRLTSDTMIVAEGVTQIVPGMISCLLYTSPSPRDS